MPSVCRSSVVCALPIGLRSEPRPHRTSVHSPLIPCDPSLRTMRPQSWADGMPASPERGCEGNYKAHVVILAAEVPTCINIDSALALHTTAGSAGVPAPAARGSRPGFKLPLQSPARARFRTLRTRPAPYPEGPSGRRTSRSTRVGSHFHSLGA